MHQHPRAVRRERVLHALQVITESGDEKDIRMSNIRSVGASRVGIRRASARMSINGRPHESRDCLQGLDLNNLIRYEENLLE
jgi:hypothetical protein